MNRYQDRINKLLAVCRCVEELLTEMDDGEHEIEPCNEDGCVLCELREIIKEEDGRMTTYTVELQKKDGGQTFHVPITLMSSDAGTIDIDDALAGPNGVVWDDFDVDEWDAVNIYETTKDKETE